MLFLLMQFVWKYIDDIMGKGVDFSVILKLMFFVSAGLIPLALPIAVLFSSIMTMGNLAESNELTSMKSSGMSLFKVMKPMLILIITLSVGTFYFSNYVLPIANLKQRTIIYDLQSKDPTFAISEGVFNKINDTSIKVDRKDKETGELYGLLIYEKNGKIVKAEKGELLKSKNDQFLMLKLSNGSMYENGKLDFNTKAKYPYRKSFFKETIVKFDMSGFALQTSDEELFKREYQMMNYRQLSVAIDSFIFVNDSVNNLFIGSLVSQTIIFDSKALAKLEELKPEAMSDKNLKLPKKTALIYNLDSLSTADLNSASTTTQNKIRAKKDYITMSRQLKGMREKSLKDYKTEWHRKFSLSFALIVLFFIGAPLGAIIKKGGLGAPLIFAVLFFLMYYILSITGENMIDSNDLTPAVGMWMSSIILVPIGLFLTYKAANDSALFDIEVYKRLMKKFSKK
jgi:lipopolysaccharide export system permease protein